MEVGMSDDKMEVNLQVFKKLIPVKIFPWMIQPNENWWD
jgi:hypothetical protein